MVVRNQIATEKHLLKGRTRFFVVKSFNRESIDISIKH
jgi:hypothetical protein